MGEAERYFLHETRNHFGVVTGREHLVVERAVEKYGLEEDYDSLEELPVEIQRRIASDSDFQEIGEDFDFENYRDFKCVYRELERQAGEGEELDQNGFRQLESHRGNYGGIIGRNIDKVVRNSESVFGYLRAKNGKASGSVELEGILEPMEDIGEVQYKSDYRQVEGNIGWRLPVETWIANVEKHAGLGAETVGLVEDSFFWEGDDHVEVILIDDGPGIEKNEIGEGQGTRIVEQVPQEYGGDSYMMKEEDKEWLEREGEGNVVEELESQLENSLGAVLAMKMPRATST